MSIISSYVSLTKDERVQLKLHLLCKTHYINTQHNYNFNLDNVWYLRIELL